MAETGAGIFKLKIERITAADWAWIRGMLNHPESEVRPDCVEFFRELLSGQGVFVRAVDEGGAREALFVFVPHEGLNGWEAHTFTPRCGWGHRWIALTRRVLAFMAGLARVDKFWTHVTCGRRSGDVFARRLGFKRVRTGWVGDHLVWWYERAEGGTAEERKLAA